MLVVYLNISVNTSGDDDVLLRAQGHALDRVIMRFEEVNLRGKSSQLFKGMMSFIPVFHSIVDST